MRLVVLAINDVFDTGLAAVLDTLATANELAALESFPVPRFECVVVGVREAVRTSLGLSVPVQPVGTMRQPDWVIVPALGTKMPEPLSQVLNGRESQDAAGHLRAWHADGARIAAACIGTFLLAESGLLHGREATTAWWLGPMFRQRYPEVRLDETRMLVPSGDVVTAGAAMGHLELGLWLVRQTSPALADMVARYLLVDPRPSQAPYMIPTHLANADPLVQRFERWARNRLHLGFSLDDAADALHVSKRTLQRRMEAVLGKSPLSYFQDLRVERAVHLLRTSRTDIETIAAEVGYTDGVTLRVLLRKRLGRGVRELRDLPGR
ncbi:MULTISPECIES: GlxA family transcriptional regulator [Sinorhizobium]|uniref:AraC family transcriptional regulator n=1 Tax=Sinorhizobium americanum TaxID=194963 RepID=A0A2S3YSZ0_9HYPH|nr:MULTISPECIES: helix-turn-helix domain-containing protein [Sinorhizobium]PDT36606.1 AraC family transcriptional regulator [Sinorhizobium sp. FG01]PDT49929.1 AraC family transcriptional regulator [Sinorhizobium sp. NG07B]POH33532.1 AraC family transcriptional regulator [Sinorhizobium americanum]POH34749.1 AraC family transcriptional regulator [Sinorhizobium americanum]